MGKYASKVLEQAQSWLGKKESDGSHKAIIDLYNAHTPLARGYKVKYTDSWCATFVSAVAIKLGYTDIMPLECSCGQMITLAQKMGIWVENDAYTPKAADIILYDWDDNGNGDNTGWADHVGIVEKVANGVITVIEGNLNDAVARRTIAVNGKTIRGYITPKYDAENTKTEDVKTVRYFELLDQMNIRQTPNGTKVGTAPKGAIVSGTELKANGNTTWLKTTYNGVSGYICVLPVSAGYAKEVSAPTTDYKALYETEKAKAEALQKKLNDIKAICG